MCCGSIINAIRSVRGIIGWDCDEREEGERGLQGQKQGCKKSLRNLESVYKTEGFLMR
jgi:hypothetical protein